MKQLVLTISVLVIMLSACGSSSPSIIPPSTPTSESSLSEPTTVTETEPTATLPQVDISYGLVAYYPMDGNALDMSGNDINGEVYNTTATSDRFGQENNSLFFNGVDSIITIPDNGLLDLINDFSISFFILGNNLSDHEWLIMTKHKAGVCQPENTSWMLRYNTDVGLRLINYDQSIECGKTILSAPDVDLKGNEWHHVVLVFNSREKMITLYIDGDLQTRMDASQLNIQNNEYPLVIGNQYNGISQHNLDGAIDELRIYNLAISEEVIQAIYTGTP